MSLLADALQPSLATGIFGVGGRLAPISLSGAITAPGASYGVSFDVPAKQIRLDFPDPSYVREVLAADAGRLATSCLQSISVAVSEEAEKYWLPWSFVRLYYAAFYAAHFVVRVLGTGCCWLEASDVEHMDTLTQATLGHPIPFPIGSGSYRCKADGSTGQMLWNRIPGRPHEALWTLFDEVLRNTGAKVLAGPLPTADAQAVFGKLEAFRNMATFHKTKSWLSRTRNEIQYKLIHDVWHPTTVDRQRRASMQRLTAQWATDPMKIDLSGVMAYATLMQFCAACAFVVGMCRVLVVRISDRNLSGSRSFLWYGPLAYAGAARLTL